MQDAVFVKHFEPRLMPRIVHHMQYQIVHLMLYMYSVLRPGQMLPGIPLEVHCSRGICILVRLQDVAAKAIQQLSQGSHHTLLIWALDQQARQLWLGSTICADFGLSACRCRVGLRGLGGLGWGGGVEAEALQEGTESVTEGHVSALIMHCLWHTSLKR